MEANPRGPNQSMNSTLAELKPVPIMLMATGNNRKRADENGLLEPLSDQRVDKDPWQEQTPDDQALVMYTFIRILYLL